MIAMVAIPALVHLLFGLWVIGKVRRSSADCSTARTPPDPGPGQALSAAASTTLSDDVVCLVAARNEETNIEACLQALLTQTVPLQVLVIDDDSTDATRSLVESWIERFGGRLTVRCGGPGKAMALQAGLESTSATTILTTDADCRPPPRWAESMVATLAGEGGHRKLAVAGKGALGALGGCTMIRHQGTGIAAVEALDWSILLATASALSDAGHPITAMGNNMAFRRGALERIGGFEFGASSLTEDYVLFREVGRVEPIAVEMDPSLLNWTEPLRSLSALFRQRRRWAIGAADGGALNAAILAGSSLAFGVPWVLLFLQPVFGLSLILARWLVQGALASAVAARLGISLPMAWIPIHDTVIAVYGAVIPLTIPFSRRTRWKGRLVRKGGAATSGHNPGADSLS
jgi:cellulose synthase/poly-beta-1,6-N-acetylglucosamine synthase-like glycosyltransferase